MAGFQVKAEMGGLKSLLERIQKLPAAMSKRVLRKMVRAGCKLVLQGMKARVPRDTLLLLKSLGVKVRIYRSGKVVGIVGPRTGFRKEVVLLKGGRGSIQLVKLKGQTLAGPGRVRYRDPIRYAHLAERQHPFARPTLDQDGPAIVGAMKAVGEDQLDSLLRG